MIDIALNHGGAIELDAIGADRALDATTDRQFLRDNVALDLRTGRQRELLNDATGGILLPGDRLLYVRRDGTALVVPFDLDKLAVTGPGFPVLEGVTVFNGAANLTVSQTGVLVYQQGPPPANEVQPARVSRAGVISPIDSAWHGPFNSFAVSPDGRRIAVGVGLESGRLDIWIKQLDRGPFTRLSFGGTNRRPAWSPDGSTVAFIHDTGATSLVYQRPVDGSTPQRLLARLDRQIQEVTWSPDGRWLYVSDVADNRLIAYALKDGALGEEHVVAVGAQPVHMAGTLDGRRVFVTNFAGKSVSVVNTATWTLEKTIDTPDALRSTVGGDAITIQTAEPERIAAGIRERFHHAAGVIEGNVRLELPDGHQWIARLVEAFPGQIDAITLGKPTLEDVFMMVTKGAVN
jgi:hypothetical protein